MQGKCNYAWNTTKNSGNLYKTIQSIFLDKTFFRQIHRFRLYCLLPTLSQNQYSEESHNDIKKKRKSLGPYNLWGTKSLYLATNLIPCMTDGLYLSIIHHTSKSTQKASPDSWQSRGMCLSSSFNIAHRELFPTLPDCCSQPLRTTREARSGSLTMMFHSCPKSREKPSQLEQKPKQ